MGLKIFINYCTGYKAGVVLEAVVVKVDSRRKNETDKTNSVMELVITRTYHCC